MTMQPKEKGIKKERVMIILIACLIIPAIIKVNSSIAGQDDIWRRRTDMPTAREDLAAAAVGGKIYAIGGENTDGVLAIVEEYDPVTNSWRRRTDMPTARYGLTTAVINGKIYAIGGFDEDNDELTIVEEYDPLANSWSRRTDMLTSRGYLAATTLNGQIYAMGGAKWREDVDQWDVRNEVEVYNPTTNSWEVRADLLDDRFRFAAVTVGNRMYAIGGLDYLEEEEELYQRESVEDYNPETDSWHHVDDLPTPRGDLGAATIGGRVFVVGGSDEDGDPLSTVEAYEPNVGRWSRWADMPTPRSKIAAVVVGGWVYVIGGTDGDFPLGTVETYEPPAFDSDGDGLTDSDEMELYGTDPLVADADTDTDGDGLTNVEEVDIYGTNINSLDTDGDGFSDKEEIDARTDPNDPRDYPITTTVPEGPNWIGFLGIIAVLSIFLRKKRKAK